MSDAEGELGVCGVDVGTELRELSGLPTSL
jgi:hypothetical protein